MIKVGIVGGTGYTGVELLRLLARIREAEVRAITSRQEAGTAVADDVPEPARRATTLAFTDPARGRLDALRRRVLRHAERRRDGAGARAGRRRRQDHRPRRGLPHQGPRGVGEVVQDAARVPRARRRSGLRPAGSQPRAIRKARIVANPGCYPTAVQLGFLPLRRGGHRRPRHLIADCKSGVSGAGRKAEVDLLFAEASDNFKAYGVKGHRHHPEIAQGLDAAASRAGRARLHAAPRADDPRHPRDALRAAHRHDVDLQALFEKRYAGEPFVDVMPAGQPSRHALGARANVCRIAVHRPQGGDTRSCSSVRTTSSRAPRARRCRT